MNVLEEIKSFLGDDEKNDTNKLVPFTLLTKNAVESLRYRAEVIFLVLCGYFFDFLKGPFLNHLV